MSFTERKMRMRAVLAAGAASAMFALPTLGDDKRAAVPSDGPKAAFVDADHEEAFQKVGQARLKVLFWSIYDSHLYTTTGEYRDGERPLKLDIKYLLDVKATALVDRTQKEWDSMGRSHPRQAEWQAQLNNIWTDIKAGDVLSLELDSENRSAFFRNDELLGRIEDPEFGQQFVDIWLSPDSTRPEIRLALLGKDD